jgi:hypothetical protein
MMKGHIAAVEFLEAGVDDRLIEQAHAHFKRRASGERFDAFEVWDGARRVYSWPESPDPSASTPGL